MLKKIRNFSIFAIIFWFVFLSVVLLLHNHKDNCDGIDDETNCTICLFIKYVSNFTFNFYKKLVVTNILFLIVISYQISEIKNNIPHSFLSRAPPF